MPANQQGVEAAAIDVTRFMPLAQRMAGQIGRPDEVDDLVQEAMIRLIGDLRRFESRRIRIRNPRGFARKSFRQAMYNEVAKRDAWASRRAARDVAGISVRGVVSFMAASLVDNWLSEVRATLGEAHWRIALDWVNRECSILEQRSSLRLRYATVLAMRRELRAFTHRWLEDHPLIQR